MGQAAVLPDPPSHSASNDAAPSLASADDLLAQLAGEEIDRLLAESESEQAEHSAADAPGASAAAAPTKLAAADPPGVMRPVALAPLTAPPPATPPKRSAEAPIQTAAQAAPSPESTPPPAEDVETTPAPDPTAAAAAEADAEIAERSALRADLPSAVPLSAIRTIVDKADEAVAAPDETLPLPLRLLEWLNAPFAVCPEALRETLGKVAIITLINAIAVLIYVALFRS